MDYVGDCFRVNGATIGFRVYGFGFWVIKGDTRSLDYSSHAAPKPLTLNPNYWASYNNHTRPHPKWWFPYWLHLRVKRFFRNCHEVPKGFGDLLWQNQSLKLALNPIGFRVSG